MRTRRPSASSDRASISSFCSSSSSSSSEDQDDEAANCRISPPWCAYRHLIQARGFHLDTYGDVKQFYHSYWEDLTSSGRVIRKDDCPGYIRACSGPDDNELCKDAGLGENLFRGSRCSDGTKVMIKAVNLFSREYDIVRRISSPSLRSNPMNHCIPILGLIEVPGDGIAFIIMEEWSPHLIDQNSCFLPHYLGAIRQCIEHIVFMHSHQMAHLDISLRNILTDCKGHYAFIDFELSRRFDGVVNPRVSGIRRTEVPPELERGDRGDPYKVDVWALGVLILRTLKLAGLHLPGLITFIQPMLSENPNQRPSAKIVLKAFDQFIEKQRVPGGL